MVNYIPGSGVSQLGPENPCGHTHKFVPTQTPPFVAHSAEQTETQTQMIKIFLIILCSYPLPLYLSKVHFLKGTR